MILEWVGNRIWSTFFSAAFAIHRYIKVKGPVLAIALNFHKSDLWTEALYSLGSGSWSTWANDTAAHYAVIHCPYQRTFGRAVCS